MEYKQNLLALLDDQEVREKILDIVHIGSVTEHIFLQNTQLDALEQEGREFKENLAQDDDMHRQLEELKQKELELQHALGIASQRQQALELEISSKNSEIEQLRNDVEEQARSFRERQQKCESDLAEQKQKLAEERKALAQCREELRQADLEKARMRDQFKPFETALYYYDLYRHECEKNSCFERILSPRDPVHFVVAGSQRTTFFLLWDEVCQQAERLSDAELKQWESILQYLMLQYNSVYQTPVLEFITEELHAPFDHQRHQKTSGCSRYQGNIKKVLLTGVRNIHKNCVERKSLISY